MQRATEQIAFVEDQSYVYTKCVKVPVEHLWDAKK